MSSPGIHKTFNPDETTSRLINRKIAEIAACEDNIPGILILFSANNYRIRYISKQGRHLLGMTNEELQETRVTRLLKTEGRDVLAHLLRENNSGDITSFFQEVRSPASYNVSWYFTGIKFLLRNKNGFPILCSAVAIPVNTLNGMAEKIERILNEHVFQIRNQHIFDTLTRREKELLKLFALGYTNDAISKKLYISADTVATHRKNIRRKLGCRSSYDCTWFAQVFNLI